MKIAAYCQYVLGIGHFFRILEICRALADHDVLLITGGPPVDAHLPKHVRHVPLTSLKMDKQFTRLLALEPGQDVEQIKSRRCRRLLDIFRTEKPDVLLIELYPFGRRAFSFEIIPLLEMLHSRPHDRCSVVCSLRDILVEKNDPQTYETRAIRILQRFFDALLVHGDPNVIRLDATFARTADIPVPLVYTGYVAPAVPEGARRRLRAELGLAADEKLVVASAGGGRIGGQLLSAAVAAMNFLEPPSGYRLQLFTGPFGKDSAIADLKRRAAKNVHIARFTTDFLSCLAAADLSLSLGGYNTCMNILAAGIPALVWPSPQDREQGLRVERLAELGAMQRLTQADLDPRRLAVRMQSLLQQAERTHIAIDMQGAAATARWLAAHADGRRRL